HFTAFHEAPVAQGWGTLGDYHVTSQSIPPGILLPRGDVVTLTVDDAVFRGPIGSIVTPRHHPTYATVPHLIGMDYRRAMAAGDGYAGSGVFTRVGTTRPLSARASACGLDAFVVAAQSPAPGTRVRWGGIRLDGRGVEPGVAAVTIDLAIRPPG
ncbi:MAG: hypothetical protein ACTHNU_13080, partial [Gaiellales bacterium]